MPGDGGLTGDTGPMPELKIGYARVSTDAQDLTVQREALAALGVDIARIYTDHGLSGTNRARPGLREAMAACRTGDTLVVTKLDRLARSVPDARDIVDELTARGVRLNLGGSVHDPTDPIGRLLFSVLSMIAEFEADLARARTREGMAVAKRPGRTVQGRPLHRLPHDPTRSRRPARRPHGQGRRAGHIAPQEPRHLPLKVTRSTANSGITVLSTQAAIAAVERGLARLAELGQAGS